MAEQWHRWPPETGHNVYFGLPPKRPYVLPEESDMLRCSSEEHATAVLAALQQAYPNGLPAPTKEQQ